LQSGQGARRREIHNARVCAGGRAGTSPMSNATRRRQRTVCSQRWRGGAERAGWRARHRWATQRGEGSARCVRSDGEEDPRRTGASLGTNSQPLG
jgi:hypothetical protein